MDKKKANIEDVAASAGVSKALVSNYLNGKHEKISGSTKLRIKNSIEELEYVPNIKYRNYKKKDGGIIGLILPDIMDPFNSLCCKAITDAALKHNYVVLMANTDNNVGTESSYLEKFGEYVDGVIIASVGKNDEQLVKFGENKPIVLLDRRMKSLTYDVVSSNNYEATQDMMNYLVGLGYEAFGFFTEDLVDGMSRVIRYQSYTDFIEASEYKYDSYLYNVNLYDEKLMMKNLVDFMEQVKGKGKKTAIICANGKTLIHVISGVNSLNLSIPNEIGICGFDDFEAAALLYNGITTISQPTYDIGYRCVEQLISRINRNENIAPQIIELRSKLVTRGSV